MMVDSNAVDDLEVSPRHRGVLRFLKRCSSGLLTILLAFCSNSNASGDERLDLALRMLEAMDLDTQLTTMAVSAVENSGMRLASYKLPKRYDHQINLYLSETASLVVSELTSRRAKLGFSALYAEAMTRNELVELITIFESGLASKFLVLTPLLEQSVLALAGQTLGDLQSLLDFQEQEMIRLLLQHGEENR